MTGTRRIGDLLDGPRGRRLCMSLVTAAHPELWTAAYYAAQSEDGIADLARGVAGASVPVEGAALIDALEVSVSSAMYWQPADDTDTMLRDDALVAALEPTARRIVEAADAQWWWSPIDVGRQRHVQWMDGAGTRPPTLTGAAERLIEWRATTARAEARPADRPTDVTARVSDSWWSIPAHADLVVTTRPLAGLGAAELRLVEDGLGWSEAAVTPLRPRPSPRVFEITGPDAWAELVARYPVDVTLSRRHDWWNVTGRDVPWAIPDWQAASSDLDAVHLTVAGYLSTAGRAIPLDDGFTLLAGWNPDETFWLTDILEPSGPVARWHRDRRLGDDPWREVVTSR
jgi:hypothetical protein